MLINQQPRETVRTVDTHVELVSMWHTIQGEGPFAGIPAVFVRLAGCNLQCPLCDTNYTIGRYSLTIEAACDLVAEFVRGIPGFFNLVVITGGEPFRQRGLSSFVRGLLDRELVVQVETNGTIHQEEFPWDVTTIVCSPKSPSIDVRNLPHIDAFKYVVRVGETRGTDGLPLRTLGSDQPVYLPKPESISSLASEGRLYIQPLDEGNEEANTRNLRHAAEICMKFGYRLSVQVHKLAGLP